MSETHLLLASEPGGHLLELAALRSVWGPSTRAWITLSSPDSECLLRDERVFFAHGPTCRNIWNLLRNVLVAWSVVSKLKPKVLLAAGSGLVVPVAWVARIRGVKVVYVECGGRIKSPSLSCRLVAPVAQDVYVQCPDITSTIRRARYVGRVAFPVSSEEPLHDRDELLLLATVGTSRTFAFDRLLSALDETRLPPWVRLVVQHGVSKVRPQGGCLFDFVPFDQLQELVRRASYVVMHGGIGSITLALTHGKHPIVMPRGQRFGEAVDDHQLDFARRMEEDGLVTVVHNAVELRHALKTVGRTMPHPKPARDDPLGRELQRIIARHLRSTTAHTRATPSFRSFGVTRDG